MFRILFPPGHDAWKLTISAFVRNDDAQAVAEYAIVSVAFGLLMLAFLAGIQNNTGSNISSTQNNLTNETMSP